MITIILSLILISSGPYLSYEVGQQEFEIALNALCSKGLLEIPDKKINIRLPAGYDCLPSEKIMIGGEEILIDTVNPVATSIIFISVIKYDSKKIKILYFASESGYRYKGEILFNCLNDKLVYDGMRYHSEID